MAQMCPAKSTIVPFKKQMYSIGSIILSYIDDKCICVSIHAPTRGATTWSCVASRFWMVSIHAPTRGATVNIFVYNGITMFQSTHPRGVRPTTTQSWCLPSSFNPRTHEGCDIVLTIRTLRLFCFNPRTHEGCDAVLPS